MKVDIVTGAARPNDTAISAVAEAPKAIMEAWGAHDPDAFAQVFTENGSMILPGIEVQGRKSISQFMDAAFQGPYQGTQVVGEPVRMTILGPDTIMMFTEGGVRPKEASEVPEGQTVRASWLMAREGDTWKIAAYQNTPKTPAPSK